MLVNAVAWAALWLHAALGRRLLSDDFPEEQRRSSTVAFVAGPAAYALAVGVAFINPYLCLGFHGALALYYALDPISRQLDHSRPD
jgi:hypothetical protein